jgi:hypothetical protein
MATSKAVAPQAAAIGFTNIFAYFNLAAAVLAVTMAVRARLTTDTDITGDDIVMDIMPAIMALQAAFAFIHVPADLLKAAADAVAAVLKNYYHQQAPAPTA